MKEIIKSDKKATMTSFDLREIINVARVEYQEPEVANRHFLARIEDELEGELGDRKSFTHPQNHKQIGYYDLTLDQCLLVGMRESKAVRRSVRDKLNVLTGSQQSMPQIPQTYAEALQLAADQTKQLEIAAPKIEFFDEYVEADSLHGFREVCKLLNANEREFRTFLVKEKVVYKLRGAWTAYQPHIDAKRMDTKPVTAHGKAFNQIMFTPKGITWIAEKWGNETKNRKAQ